MPEFSTPTPRKMSRRRPSKRRRNSRHHDQCKRKQSCTPEGFPSTWYSQQCQRADFIKRTTKHLSNPIITLHLNLASIDTHHHHRTFSSGGSSNQNRSTAQLLASSDNNLSWDCSLFQNGKVFDIIHHSNDKRTARTPCHFLSDA